MRLTGQEFRDYSVYRTPTQSSTTELAGLTARSSYISKSVRNARGGDSCQTFCQAFGTTSQTGPCSVVSFQYRPAGTCFRNIPADGIAPSSTGTPTRNEYSPWASLS